MSKKEEPISPSPTLHPNLLRWLSYDDVIAANGIDIHCLADEIHEFAQNLSIDRLDAIIGKLLAMYRGNQEEFKHFVHQFIPLLVNLYVKARDHNREQNVDTLEIFLLGVYNISLIADTVGPAQVPVFQRGRLDGTVYSPPGGQVRSALPLKTFHIGGRRFQPISSIASILDLHNVFLRLIVLFNESVSSACWQARHQFCLLARHVATKEKDAFGNLKSSFLFSVPAAIEIVSCLHYLCRNDQSSSAESALQAFHERGYTDIIPELMLLTRSVLLLLQDFQQKSDQMTDATDISRASIFAGANNVQWNAEESSVHSDVCEMVDANGTGSAVSEDKTTSPLEHLKTEIKSTHDLEGIECTVPAKTNSVVKDTMVVPDKKHILTLFGFQRKKRTKSQHADDSRKVSRKGSQLTL